MPQPRPAPRPQDIRGLGSKNSSVLEELSGLQAWSPAGARDLPGALHMTVTVTAGHPVAVTALTLTAGCSVTVTSGRQTCPARAPTSTLASPPTRPRAYVCCWPWGPRAFSFCVLLGSERRLHPPPRKRQVYPRDQIPAAPAGRAAPRRENGRGEWVCVGGRQTGANLSCVRRGDRALASIRAVSTAQRARHRAGGGKGCRGGAGGPAPPPGTNEQGAEPAAQLRRVL